MDEEIKKSSQLAEDNKILLEKIQLIELEKTDLLDKVKEMEADNLNLMKYYISFTNCLYLDYQILILF